jgi:hypothetical protein
VGAFFAPAFGRFKPGWRIQWGFENYHLPPVGFDPLFLVRKDAFLTI